MRPKLRNPRRAETPVHGDPTPIDLSDTAQRLALFEAGNGLQHGVIEIVVALMAAFLFVLPHPFLRPGSRDRR